MQSVQCSLSASETPPFQTAEAAHPNPTAQDKYAANEKEQSDRQSAAEALYAAFVWLFGPGCY